VIVVELRDLSKTFRLDDAGSVSLLQVMRARFRPSSRNRPEIRALRDIDLEIEKGEKIGVVGTNGSGKTTLMRVMAGIYEPTEGRVRVEGRIASFLQLGTGVIQRLTVRENVFLYGAVLGLTRSELQRRFDAILAFAELEEFADIEVRRLSSGMIQRLSFAVAVEVEADILLLDEILAVGDQHFRNKCYEYFTERLPRETTVVFSSHTLKEIETFCTRTLWLDDGRIAALGSTADVIERYKRAHGYPLEERGAKEGPGDGSDRHVV
jgi:lipopolysaccharide transport system ATP-binding protein